MRKRCDFKIAVPFAGVLVVAFVQVLFLAVDRGAAAADSNTDDGSGAFADGRYRNLFAKAGHAEQDIQAKIDAAFQQLFHGDPNTQTLYYPAGSNANGTLYLMSLLHCSGQFRIWPPQ
jgi:hypothetical protein